jgi:3-oxoacyl-[acyl-carrier-protein] synthase-3
MADTVYINGLGSYLPGPPIANDEIEVFLGPFDDRERRIGRKALKQNGIRQRHYALDRGGKPQTTNAEMAARAAQAAVEASELTMGEIGYLAAAASQGDLLAPGFASMVHGALTMGPAEIASFSSFCASGMMALKSAHDGIRGGARRNALVCASEFASRFLRASYFDGARLDTDAQFLRFMLSDGAGALVLEDRPNANRLSLKIEWIDLVSYADKLDVCMYAGMNKNGNGMSREPWSHYANPAEAFEGGAFQLRQDLKLLDHLIPLGLGRYFELIDEGRIDPNEVDWALYHFSSDIFRKKLIAHADRAGAAINQNRIFTNLYEKGNTGSASILIMLEELFSSGRLEPGQKIFCMVPESGRFIVSFMLLSVVGPENGPRKPIAHRQQEKAAGAASAAARRPVTEKLVRDLSRVWVEFETALSRVPIVEKLERGRLRIEDYRALLLNLRQQVIEGSRWIARSASHIGPEHAALRTSFVQHAGDEQQDYRMLEEDFVACGGDRDAIVSAEKNIGSEALSAWMFHKASRENPFDLLGAMFIIEGLGNRLATRWGEAIKDQLGLRDDQVRFLLYHGENDETHLERLWAAIDNLDPSPELARAIVKTAKVTARLYRLQLEELGNT